MVETLWTHRRMIGNPKYGVIGLVALPFFLFVETLGPLVEGVGYAIVPIAFLLGILNVPFFLLFLAVAIGVGPALSPRGRRPPAPPGATTGRSPLLAGTGGRPAQRGEGDCRERSEHPPPATDSTGHAGQPGPVIAYKRRDRR